MIAMHPERVNYCSLNRFWPNWEPKNKSVYPWYYRDIRKALNGEDAANFTALRNAIEPPIIKGGTGAGCFCCAQFAVSRKRIQAHPRSVYEQLLRYLIEEPTTAQNPSLNLRCAQMERLWHLLL